MWRPKVINRYIPTDNSSDIDEGFFYYKCYSKAVFQRTFQWKDTDRQDLISYQEDKDSKELHAHIKIGEDASNEHKSTIINLVKIYWDFFARKDLGLISILVLSPFCVLLLNTKLFHNTILSLTLLFVHPLESVLRDLVQLQHPLVS